MKTTLGVMWALHFFCVIACNPLHAQLSPADIAGTWTGNYYGAFAIMPPQKLVVEIRITDDTIVSGTSHLFHHGGMYEHYTIRGVWRPADSSIFFAEDSTLGVDVGAATNCTGDYKMRLGFRKDTVMRLDGKWRDNMHQFLGCPPSRVYLEKPVRKALVVVAPRRPAALDRTPDVQGLLELSPQEMDSLRIELADDAEVDGDVVSLYLNDEPLIEGLRLSGEAHTVWATVPRGKPVSSLRLIAESEGNLPPCTARVAVFTAAGKTYAMKLSSSRNSNAVLELFEKSE